MQEIQDDIIFKFKEGDRAAFDTIYLRFRKPIITFCKYMVPVDYAQDITNDIFVKLWNTRDQWDNIKNVKAFLYISARNACFNFVKYQKMKSGKEKKIREMLEREQEKILQSQIEAELITLIKQEVDTLPENCRTVFIMSYFEGYKNAEIAEKLSLTDKTVRNLKSIAVNTIKKNFQGKGLQLSTILLLLQIIKRLN